MPERMSEAYSCLSEADDSADYTYRCVRRKPDDEMPDEIIASLHVVEGWQIIESCQQIVNEVCHSYQVVSAGIVHDDVLRFYRNDLVGVLERAPVSVSLIAQLAKPLHGSADLCRPEVSEGSVCRIKPDCAVLEHGEITRCSEDPFLERFWTSGSAHQAFDALYKLRLLCQPQSLRSS